MKRFSTALLISTLSLAGSSALAAGITYGDAYNIGHTDQTRVLNTFDANFNGGFALPGSPSVVAAVSYGNNGTPTVNGINFTQASGASDFWGNTGIDPNIDTLLSGHTNTSGTTNPFTLNLTGLVIGNVYQVQLIGIHDSRTAGSINTRQYEVSYGGNDFTSGGTAPVLTRNAYGNNNTLDGGSFDGIASHGTVAGIFIADATTQSIQLRSNQQDGNTGDDPDPGLSGYVLINGGAASQTYSLLDEEFTGGAQPTNTSFVTWSDSDGGSFETYNSGGAGPRDMNSSYDHDQDGGTADITIPGGIEVNDDAGAGQVTLTATLDLSSLAGHSFTDSTLSFFAGTRGATNPPTTVEILNLTDSTTVLAATAITINANDNIWEYNELTGLLGDDDAGDTIQINWFGSGTNSASGLQLADIELTASTVVPEPGSLALLGLGGLLIARRRRD